MVTAPEDRAVDAPVSIRLDHLDPIWGVAALVGIDWGDGTPPLLTTVESVRQGQTLDHRYKTPSSARISVLVAERFAPGGV